MENVMPYHKSESKRDYKDPILSPRAAAISATAVTMQVNKHAHSQPEVDQKSRLSSKDFKAELGKTSAGKVFKPLSSSSDDLAVRSVLKDPRDELSHLIASLRANYYSFVKHKGSHDPSFFSVAKVDLPLMRADSPFKCMEPFIQAAKAFLDGQQEKEFVSELVEFEKEIDQRYMKIKRSSTDGETLTRIQIFLQVLDEFEVRTGFSAPVEIAKDAGPKKDGLISPKEFNQKTLAGHPFIDYGATTQHGPHSHRVQFYLLGQFFNKNAKLFSTDHSIEKIKALIIQFKILPSMDAAALTDKFIASHFISIFYRMFGVKEFTGAFDWKKFNVELATKNTQINPGREVPFDMNIPHIWVQLFDRRGYKGEGTVPSTFGILQLLGALKSVPRLGVPNITGSQSLRDIVAVTKPIYHAPPIKLKSVDYLDLAASTKLVLK